MNILLVLNVAPGVPVLGLHIILDVRSSDLLFTVATIHDIYISQVKNNLGEHASSEPL